jgi:hypothetical protein
MSNSLLMFREPDLEFRYNQRVKDPRDGLALFGPYDTDLAGHPQSVPYIVLGTPEGINAFAGWSSLMNGPSIYAPDDNYRLWPPFPGFEAAFHCQWPTRPVWTHEVDPVGLSEASRQRQAHERAYSVVEHYMEGLRLTKKLDDPIAVAVCIVPDEVWANCRPESVVPNPVGKYVPKKVLQARQSGQLDMFEEYNPDQYQLSTDFRRQLKARAMEFGIPLQIIRQSTLRPTDENQRGKRGLTPLSDRMWNITTALYYKAGGKPWRLVTAREGVCYIGIAFRRADSGQGRTACCAAQMFLNTGDGVVFLGDFGPWYSPQSGQFRLTKQAARSLLEGTLKTYAELEGKPLTEIFLHSRSGISREEFEGYQEACPSGVQVVGVRARIDRNNPRLYRLGQMPVARGTFWRLNDRTGYLWGAGFKPRAATYVGWEVPVPLRIDIQHGDAPIERVAQDIYGLTKLNYNACRLGDAEPVTVGFSDAVGEILVTNPAVKQRRHSFKHYI